MLGAPTTVIGTVRPRREKIASLRGATVAEMLAMSIVPRMSGDRRVIEATPGSPLQASAPNAHPAQGAVMIRNSIFISLDSFFAGGRVGPVVLHRNWREQVVLTGGTNAPALGAEA